MPRWKELPDGRWVVVPSVNTYYDQLTETSDTLFRAGDYSDPNYLLRQAERLRKREKLTPAERGFSPDERTLLGSLTEGVKAIPGGVLDLATSGAEAAIGILTPGVDLPIEKRLRKISQDRAAARDPLYQDALAVGVGQGLGQVAGLTALTRVPGIGRLLGVGSAISLGISDQTRRLAEYEQRTGQNIPWYKETMAHLLGGAIGLSEVILPHKLANVGSVSRMQKMLSRVAPVDLTTAGGKMRSALESTAIEGIQEGLAQGLQSMTARGLYDPNALEDLGSAMMEDLKVGGIVGGIADVASTMLLGPNKRDRGGHLQEQLQSAKEEILKSNNAFFASEQGQQTLDAINNGLVADPLAAIMDEFSIDSQTASDLSYMFDNDWSGMSEGITPRLIKSGIPLEQLESIRDELKNRTDNAIKVLEDASKEEGAKESGLDKNYRSAARAVGRLQTSRLGVINRSLEELGSGWRRLGGISDSDSYQRYWKIGGIENNPTYDNLAAETAKPTPDESMITRAIEGFMGGAYGRFGLKTFAEILGIRKGPGSEKVDVTSQDPKAPPIDRTLASSDAGSFGTDDIGRAVFGIDGTEGDVQDLPYGDVQDDMDIMSTTSSRINELEKEANDIEKKFPRFRVQGEQAGQIDSTANDREWQRVREQNTQQGAIQRGNIYNLIAQQREARGDAYTRALRNRLVWLQNRYFNDPKNSEAKRNAIARLGFDKQYGKDRAEVEFDRWLQEQIDIVQESEEQAISHRKKQEEKAKEIQQKLSRLDPAQAAQARITMMPAVQQQFRRRTKNISATNLVRLSKLFNVDAGKATDIIDQSMILKAMADIGVWQVDNSDRAIENGVLVLDETVPLVRNFIDVELKNRQEAQQKIKDELHRLSGRQNISTEDLSFNSVVLNHPNMTAAKLDKIVKKYGYTREQMQRLITEEDIQQLLGSKNIFLRGSFEGDAKDGVRGNLGKAMEQRLGTGVYSRPFQKLLTDLTGALDWESASEAQRLLLYSRLLQLPSHRIKKGVKATQLYDPMYLPDFYQTNTSRKHLNELAKVITGTPAKADDKKTKDDRYAGATTKIPLIREAVKKNLKNEFDPVLFDEALATLVETGLITHGRQSDPLFEEGTAPGVEEGEAIVVEDGKRGSAGNPRQKNIDKIIDPVDGPNPTTEKPLPSEVTAGRSRLQQIREGKKRAIILGRDEKYHYGEVVTLRGDKRPVITPENMIKILREESPYRGTVELAWWGSPTDERYTPLWDGYSLENEPLESTTGEAGGVPIFDDVLGETVNMKSVEHALAAQSIDPTKDSNGTVFYNPNSATLTGGFDTSETLDDLIRVVPRFTIAPDGTPRYVNEDARKRKERALFAAGWQRGETFNDNALRRAIYTIGLIAEQGYDARVAERIGHPVREARAKKLNIYYGKKQNASLSNLAARPFNYQGRDYVSVEHAYQTLKSGSFDKNTYEKKWKAGSKFKGKEAKTDINIDLMRQLVRESFLQNPEAQQALLDTGNQLLTHNQDKTIWQYQFPRILMEIRQRFAEVSGRKITDQTHRVIFIEDTYRTRVGRGKDGKTYRQEFDPDPNIAGKIARSLQFKLRWNPKKKTLKRFTQKQYQYHVNKKTGEFTGREVLVPVKGVTARGKKKTSVVYYEDVGPYNDPITISEPVDLYERLLEAKVRGNSEVFGTLMDTSAKIEEVPTDTKKKELQRKENELRASPKYKSADVLTRAFMLMDVKPRAQRSTGPTLERIRLETNRERYRLDDINSLVLTPRGLIPRGEATLAELQNANDEDPVTVQISDTVTPLHWDVAGQTIAETNGMIDEAITMVEPFRKAKTLTMSFSDDQQVKGVGRLVMQKRFRGKSTYKLIQLGERTGTSRRRADPSIKRGDIIRIKDPSDPRFGTYVQVMSDWMPMSEVDPDDWMKAEGWDRATYDLLAEKGYQHIRYVSFDHTRGLSELDEVSQRIAGIMGRTPLGPNGDTKKAAAAGIKAALAKFFIGSGIESDTQKPTTTYKMFSGDAPGSDKIWESIGREYGLEDVTHYTTDTLTEEESAEAYPYLIEANKKIGRKYPSDVAKTNKLLERDYLQARDADAVFAIGTITPPSKRGTNRWAIKGGTQWAVQIAIDMGKPVYIFNQKDGKWYTTTNGMDLKVIDTPTLTPNFAAIGTQNLTASGSKAIRDVFKKSMPKAPPTEAEWNNTERYREFYSMWEDAFRETEKDDSPTFSETLSLSPTFVMPNSKIDTQKEFVNSVLFQYLKAVGMRTEEGWAKRPKLNQLGGMVWISADDVTVDDKGLHQEYRNVQDLIEMVKKARAMQPHMRIPLPTFVLSSVNPSIGEAKIAEWLTKAGYRKVTAMKNLRDMQENPDYYVEGDRGVWIPTGATEFAMDTKVSADDFQTRVDFGEKIASIKEFDPNDAEDAAGWVEVITRVFNAREEFRRTGLVPYLDQMDLALSSGLGAYLATGIVGKGIEPVTDQLLQDPHYLAPWYRSVDKNTPTQVTPTNMFSEYARLIEAMPLDLNQAYLMVDEHRASALNSEQWSKLFSQLGITETPWDINDLVIPDEDMPEVTELDMEDYRNKIYEFFGVPRGQQFIMRNQINVESVRDSIKYEKLVRRLFPDIDTPVFFARQSTKEKLLASNTWYHKDRTGKDRPYITLFMDSIKDSWASGPDKRGNLNGFMTRVPGERLLEVYGGFKLKISSVDQEATMKNLDDYIAIIIAHEKAHSALASTDVGIAMAAGYDLDPTALSTYENMVNVMAVVEKSRVAFDQVASVIEEKRKERRDEPPPEFDDDTVTVDTDHFHDFYADNRYLTDYFVEPDQREEWYAPPGSDRRMEIDREVFKYHVQPKQVKKILEDKDLSGSVKKLVDRYNQDNSENKLSEREYIERFASHIVSDFGFRELSEMGILDTVETRIKKASEVVPADTFLEINTPEGAEIISTLIAEGAIPASLKKRGMAIRREFINNTKLRFEALKGAFENQLTNLRIPDNIKKVFVDDANGLFQGVAEVQLRGEMLPQTQPAVYDSASNRIIINLAAIDPNEMQSALEVMQEAGLHEGVHALLRRDHLYDHEIDIILDYAKNNVVSKQWDAKAHEMGVTWFERSVYKLKDTNLNESDIEEEAMTDLMMALVQNKVPEAMVKNRKLRKTKGLLRSIFEGVVESAKESDITDVLQILASIESGRVGSRGSGYQGDTEFTEGDEIRNTRLVRYADPEQVDELIKAIALRDAAKTPAMRDQEQAKVTAIADKIAQQRTNIQRTAGEVSQLDAISNIREGVKETRDENSYAIPLLNGEIWTNPNNREARQAALDEFLKARRGEAGYTMPREYMDMFNRQHKVTKETKALVDGLVADGAISSLDGDTFRKSLESGALSGDPRAGNDPKETLDNLEKSTVSQMRFQYLDRRQWTVEQEDRILAAQDRAMLDAMTSAMVMWRNADNTVNWLGAMLKEGPLSYLGTSTGRGEFDVAPVYDDELAEKYGGDGRVLGLLDIFSFVSQPIDEQAAVAYGRAKRIQWTKKRRDETEAMIRRDPEAANLLMQYEDQELQDRLNLFKDAYNSINPLEALPNGQYRRQWSEESLEKVISQVEANEPHIIEFWDNYQAYNRAMIRMAYNASLITRDQRDEWLEMPYTPFYRETSETESFPIGSGQQMAKRGRVNIQKALKGSQEPISSDLMNSIMENTQALVRDAMINVAASRTGRDSIALGEGRWTTVTDMAGNIDQRVIRIMEQGVAKHIELDDAQQAMAVMMLGFNPKKRLEELFGGLKVGEYVSKGLTGSSSLLREAVTRTPPFQIKNILRDSWQASTIVGGGPRLVLDAITNAIDPDILRRAEERGLSIGIDFVAEPGEYGNSMRKQLERSNLDWTNPLAPFSAIWTFLGRIAKQSEVATRVAVYDRVLATTGDRALAQYLAVEIMNYGRRGANPIFSTYMATVPFMNGRLQGMDVVWRGLRSKKGSSDIPSLTAYGMTQSEYADLPWWEQNRAQIANRGLVLSVATALMYWLMSDDEEYQDLRDEVKADNWIFPLGDHSWLKIPIPFEVGVLFKVIPEQIMRAMMEEQYDVSDVSSELTRQLRTSLSLGAPQLFAPIFGAMRNYDTYRKDYIVDPFMEAGISPNEQRNRFTSNTARTIADAVNMIPLVNNLGFLTSPMKMEYMLRQYFGTMGGYVTTVADRIARLGIVPSVPFDPLTNWSEAESIVGTSVDFDWKSLVGGPGVANVPILGDLLTDPRTRAGRQQQFYELVQELDQVVGTLNSITERDLIEGVNYADKHRELLTKKGQIRSMERQMKAWRERRDQEFDISRESITDDQKRQRYQALLDTRLGILYSMDELLKNQKRAREPFRWGGK